MKKLIYTLIIFFLFFCNTNLTAQPGSTIELKKPEQYENRTLVSEKTTTAKLPYAKKIFQNTITHYNYYFNANNRLNDIIQRAKAAYKESYTKLLPFYNYSLDVTAYDGDIDSIIYKCNAGILLHDLRNDWIDDLYFLMGKAYYFRKDFDSSAHVFQYINYAFAPKDEGYDISIGSNASNHPGVFSISEKENQSFLKKLTSYPPRRNEDLLWIAKNNIDAGKSYEAISLLEILRHDPQFPERLQPDLHEALAYWFYTQKIYDSAATHLIKAMDNAANINEKARWEFLAGQLFQISKLDELSAKYFTKSAEHTLDPVMEVYARLNSIAVSGGDTSDIIQQKIDGLLKLAHKDKFVNYRDIIYYSAAQLEAQRNNMKQAHNLLLKSVKYNAGNPEQRSLSFLLIADIEYANANYVSAKNFYDSVELGVLTNEDDKNRVSNRQPALANIAENIKTIHTQDSLQTVARMPEAERNALIKKTLRQLRKAQGLQEDAEGASTPFVNAAVQQPLGAPNIFSGAGKGEWYFNNPSLKGAGFNSFRAAWGNRPNVDNWRRLAGVNQSLAQQSAEEKNAEDSSMANENGQKNLSGNDSNTIKLENVEDAGANGDEELDEGDITFDALLKRLPLTDERLKASNNKIANALFNSGVILQNELEDYNKAIEAYETLNKRFPENQHVEESLFNLYYCYIKTGKKFSADSALNVLNTEFKNSKWTALLNDPATGKKESADPATKKYETIYNLFIEGKFEEAKAQKAIADSTYGNTYWTPQLLYIESIYYVSTRDDSTAIDKLKGITAMGNNTPLAEKAETMIDVLSRRSEIESYLTSLQITRYKDDEVTRVVDLNPVETIVDKRELKKDSVVSNPLIKQQAVGTDTSKAAVSIVRTYTFNPDEQQFVAILLNKVDPVYVNETRNAFNRFNMTQYYATQKPNVTSVKLDSNYMVVLVGPFTDAATAITYVDKVKPVTGNRIIPWLATDKYSFTMISQSNIDILQQTKDLEGYKKLIEKALPGKF